MAASQGFVGGETSWGSPFNTQALQQHKEGWGGVRRGKKIGGDGLVAWIGEVGGATSLTPHHLLPRLSEDKGRARVRGGVCERVHREAHVYLRARTC